MRYLDMQGLLGIDYKELFEGCNNDNFQYRLMPYLYYGKKDKKQVVFPYKKPAFYFKDGLKYRITHFIYFLFDNGKLAYVGCSTLTDRLKHSFHRLRSYTDWACMPICDGNGFKYERLLNKRLQSRDSHISNS